MAKVIHVGSVVVAAEVGEAVGEEAEAVFFGILAVEEGLTPDGIHIEGEATKIHVGRACFLGEGSRFPGGERQNVCGAGTAHMPDIQDSAFGITQQQKLQQGQRGRLSQQGGGFGHAPEDTCKLGSAQGQPPAQSGAVYMYRYGDHGHAPAVPTSDPSGGQRPFSLSLSGCDGVEVPPFPFFASSLVPVRASERSPVSVWATFLATLG